MSRIEKSDAAATRRMPEDPGSAARVTDTGPRSFLESAMRRWTWARTVMAMLAGCMLVAHEAAAQSAAPTWQGADWKVGATLYLYGPSIDGSFAFPKRS